jgi:hypothetical protein
MHVRNHLTQLSRWQWRGSAAAFQTAVCISRHISEGYILQSTEERLTPWKMMWHVCTFELYQIKEECDTLDIGPVARMGQRTNAKVDHKISSGGWNFRNWLAYSDCDYSTGIRRRAAEILPATTLNLASHKLKDDGHLQEIRTGWLISQDTGLYQQQTELLVPLMCLSCSENYMEK